jgi:hypothetical protein
VSGSQLPDADRETLGIVGRGMRIALVHALSTGVVDFNGAELRFETLGEVDGDLGGRDCYGTVDRRLGSLRIGVPEGRSRGRE